MVNIDEIVERCEINSASTQQIISNISNLEEFYENEDLIEIYNYLLTNTNNSDILSCVIKLSDSHKDSSTLAILLDILLLKSDISVEQDELINIRVLCTKVIANYKDYSTVSPLVYCLNNKNENYKVRLACADALGRIGDRYAVAPLINILEDDDEKSVYVKESATFALGLLGDTSAIDPLVSIIEAKQGLLDKFSFLKEKIVEALGRLNFNSSKVLRVFKMSLSDSSPIVRINAIEALMNSEYDEAPSLIRSALHDENEEVQKNALIALYNIEGRDVLDEIISLPSYSQALKDEAKNIINEYEEDE